ncbi:MAG: AMP-binding protein [Treponema sp.]|nr:AMP-binding protein [Treponema sp.]MCL2272456.1 AMP-binding protein [Treponema sp.]
MLDFKDYISNLPDLPYKNFADMIDITSRDHANRDAILYRCGKQREFTRWSYAKWGDECKKVARGLLAAGLVKGDRVVLWSENRPQWMSVWMGTLVAGICIVPVDFLATEQECLNIIKITKAKAFFYSGRKKDFASSLKKNGVSLSVSVCISPESDEESPAQETEYTAFGKDCEKISLPAIDSISPDDPASIVFTSGTTGFAKGVTLSHKNIIANTSAAIRILQPDDNDVFIDVLPLHHTYPTTCSFIAPLSLGIPTVICEKIVGKVVVDDIRDGGVTFLIAVPLLYDKVMAAIDNGYQKLSPLLRAPLNALRKAALAQARKGNPEFGRKVFRFIRKKASLHSIKIMVAGGGPLSITTADFFDSFGFNIIQGYGMSENAPLISVNTPRHKRNESVGLPVSYTDVKIIDVTPDGIGEIACKSPSIMLGYYENDEATREVINEDGYLLTGDLGYRDKDGFIYIVGRKKNLIVGSGGKNIYPEEVESHFSASRVIAEVLVVGKKESGGEIIYGVMVPNYDFIKEDYPGKENDEAFIYELIKKEVEAANRALPVFKKIGGFTVRKEPFEKNAQQKIRRFLYTKEYS